MKSVLLAAVLAVTGAVGPGPQPPADAEGAVRLMAAADRAFEKDDWASAAQAMESLIESPAFAELSSSSRHHALVTAGIAENNLRHYSRALPLLVRATEMPEAIFR